MVRFLVYASHVAKEYDAQSCAPRDQSISQHFKNDDRIAVDQSEYHDYCHQKDRTCNKDCDVRLSEYADRTQVSVLLDCGKFIVLFRFGSEIFGEIAAGVEHCCQPLKKIPQMF